MGSILHDPSIAHIATDDLLRVPIAGLREGGVLLDADAAHYLTRVHRLGVGERFLGFDPEQAIHAEGSVVEVARGKVRCSFEAPRQAVVERRYTLQLLQGIGKADKPDRIVRAATELGATRIDFVHLERSVVSIGDKVQSRLARLKAVAIEAARQSGRPDLPQLGYLADLEQGLAQLTAGGCRLMLDANGGRLPELLSGDSPVVTLLIGPEGGFTPEERELALRHGFTACRLADHVLRTETAAIAAVAAVVATLS
ncbi:MAG TPA: RsmE family RNA methyltransferase [Polyangiaceae bacterium]|nr:RsmE family RNA methyltransferase [Polyangiaceae bacterium]